MTGTANQKDVFVVDTTASERIDADVIRNFEDGRDIVKFTGNINNIWVQKDTSRQNVTTIIRSSDDATAPDNILVVIEDFGGVFDINDLFDDNIVVAALPDIS